ncbi:MAG: DnaJ domain-containing protein [Actinomycetales bacterium]|nr:DnaJ domain-containing protein [Actinomycetales bacterium]
MASQDWFDKDFYAVLGVKKDVTDAELKKVYRKLAREFHPDSKPGDAAAEARFKEISEAYSVLSDKEMRAEYDQIRAMGSGARFTAGGAGAGGFEDIFGSMFGGGAGARGGRAGSYSNSEFEDILSGMFGGAGGGRRRSRFDASGGFSGYGGPSRGQDIHAETTLDFRSAVRGEMVVLKMQSGSETKVRIPAGVADGQKIKLRGRGAPSPDGGEAGDIVVTVHVRKHPVFERDGLHLRVDLPVTVAEAALGATVEVPTLDGDPVRLKVPAGTPSGRVLRVKGRGVQTKTATGDLLATVQVVVPSHLSDKAKAALEEFAKALPDENPREDLLARARQ